MTLSILRANNPCALRPLKRARWNGQTGEVHLEGGRYARFRDMAHGLRAALRNLHTYRTRHGLSSVRAIIGRWAPLSDNNPTPAYVRNVSGWLRVRPDEPLDFDYRTNRALLLAIARQETGGRYVPREADIDAAFRMMAAEERREGEDPRPYMPSAAERPVERTRSAVEAEAKRVPRRWWAAIGATISGVIAWAQEALFSLGVYPREALAILRDALAGVPAWQLWAGALIALGAVLIFMGRRPDPLTGDDDDVDTGDAADAAGDDADTSDRLDAVPDRRELRDRVGAGADAAPDRHVRSDGGAALQHRSGRRDRDPDEGRASAGLDERSARHRDTAGDWDDVLDALFD